MVYQVPCGKRVAALAFAALGLAIACESAQAQTMNANSAGYNAGYGRAPGQENQPVSQTMRDANGDSVLVDGMVETGSDQSTFSNGGAGDTVAGAGALGASSSLSSDLAVVTVHEDLNLNSKRSNTGNSGAHGASSEGVGYDQ